MQVLLQTKGRGELVSSSLRVYRKEIVGRGPFSALQPLEAGEAKDNVFSVGDDVNSALRWLVAIVADQACAVLVGDGVGRARAGNASMGRSLRQSSSPEIDWLRAVRRHASIATDIEIVAVLSI